MGLGEHLPGRTVQNNGSFLNKYQPVAVQSRKVEIMDGADDGHAFAIECFEQIVDFCLCPGVQAGGRFVQQE